MQTDYYRSWRTNKRAEDKEDEGAIPLLSHILRARPSLPQRAVIAFICLVLCGCSSRVTQQEVTDSTGNNRLARIDRRIRSVEDALQGRRSYDFDSLVWRTNAGGAWRDRTVISRAAFQA